MNAPANLTPEMPSRKVMALGMIRTFISQHGYSPTYGEIGEALGIGRLHARDVVRRLVRDEKLKHVRGERRGIRLPLPEGVKTIADVIAMLRAQGMMVDDDVFGAGDPHTYTPLPMLPALEHIPDIQFESGMIGDAGEDGQRYRNRGDAGDRGARTRTGDRRAA